MAKAVTLGGIFIAIVLIAVLYQLPSGDVTDSKSAIKNAQQGLAMDTVVKAEGEIIKTVGDQAIESACKNGSSQGCSTTVSSINLIAVAFVVLIIVIIAVGIIGFAKWIMNVIESF